MKKKNILIKSILLLVFVSSVFLIASCAVPQIDDDPDIAEIQNDLSKEPRNTKRRVELLKIYIDRYKKNNESRYLDQAIKQATILLSQDEQNLGAKIRLYSMISEKSLKYRDRVAALKLRVLYQEHRDLQLTNVHPPSYILAILDLQQFGIQGNAHTLKETLKRALKEKPSHVPSNLLLSAIYEEEGRNQLAITLLKNAEQKNPGDLKIKQRLGELYEDTGMMQYCAGGAGGLLKRALTKYKEIIAVENDNKEAHSALAGIYGRMGKGALSVFAARKYAEIEHGEKGRLRLAGALYDTGKAEDAIGIYESILAEDPSSHNAMHMYARSMFSLGKWQEAAKAWEEYRRQDDDPYFYGRLTESLSIEQYKGLKAGREHFLNLVGHLQLSPWEQSLKVYHLGEISDSQLLGKAKNACERTEAYYYIGFQFWVAGRKEKAREYMKSAIDENIYGFNEYISARYHLHQL